MISPFVHVLKIGTIAAMAILVALGGRTFFDYYQEQEADPLLGRPFNLSISEDDDGETLAKRLSDGDMIRSELYFTTALRVSGNDLAPGTYTLRHGMSVSDILDTVSIEAEEDEDGEERAAVETIEITFPEGLRYGEMADIVEDAGLPWGAEEFMSAVETAPRSGFDFLDSVPDDVSLEGYLFPAKYPVNTDYTATDLVIMMLGKFEEEFVPEMVDRAEEMDLTIHEVVTLASIVEREAAVADERSRIAQVYLNRINIPEETEGLLQADPTVVYILGNEDDWRPILQPNQAIEDQDVIDNPYNTYLFPGLPPGPIANPGISSIIAVLNPDGSDFFYFVAMDDGSGKHAFARTYQEQLQNECLYLQGTACD